MRERNEVAQVRERFAEGDGDEARELSPRRWPRVLGAFAALFVAAVAAGVLLNGCGRQNESATGTESSAAVATPESGGQAQVASAVATPAQAQGLSAEELAVREGLPPDLSVSVPDTLVVPGEVVDFTVLGTTDVTDVALSDGRDEPLPFVRDKGTDAWRVQYRVPLHPRSERFGVSVTAKTELGRWRRVWVFLHIERGDSTEADQAPVDNPDELAGEK